MAMKEIREVLAEAKLRCSYLNDIKYARIDADHILAELMAAGFVVVPREPTDEVIRSVAKAIFETTSGHCRSETFEQAGGDVPSSGVQKVYCREARAAIIAFLDALNGSKTPSE